MRKVLSGLAVVAALAVASSSFAATGTVTMSWNNCNSATPATDVAVTAGQTTGLELMVSVTGQDDPTQSYQCQILYGNSATKTVPDAWRFDPSGCQGLSIPLTIDHLAPAAVSKTCPSFQNAGGSPASVQIKDCSFCPASLPYATTLMRISCANAYPSGNVPVAATHYFLVGAKFDQTFGSVGPTPADNSTCGNLEIPICFNLMSATYIINDGSGNEIPFTFHGGATGDWATAHEASSGSAPTCQATPAQSTTWGHIKSQYRD